MQFFTLGENNKLTGPRKEIKEGGLRAEEIIYHNNIKLKYNAFMSKLALKYITELDF